MSGKKDDKFENSAMLKNSINLVSDPFISSADPGSGFPSNLNES